VEQLIDSVGLFPIAARKATELEKKGSVKKT
jgi:hypothetical protein